MSFFDTEILIRKHSNIPTSVEPFTNSACPANAASSAIDGVEVWSTD